MINLTEQKTGKWNEDDRLDLARLLIKGGYQVKIAKRKTEGAKNAQIIIEVAGDGGE